MAERRILYPGTFDPITFGHLDLIKRACVIFDEVVVAIAANPHKTPLFSAQERTDMAIQACRDIPQVKIEPFDCLLTDFAKRQNIHVIMRGLRALTDFEYELQLANMNRRMMSEFETFFLTPGEEYAYISSSLVREIACYQGDVSSFVPKVVVNAFKNKFK